MYIYMNTVRLGLRVKGGGGRERDKRSRALRATRPHTVGYIGACDQEQGEIESVWDRHGRTGAVRGLLCATAGGLDWAQIQ